MPESTVEGFVGEFAFLSNFYESPIEAVVRGAKRTFGTSEHVFQAYKLECCDLPQPQAVEWVNAFADAQTPGVSKRLGRKVPLNRAARDVTSEHFMKVTLFLKFTQHPDLLQKLIDTDDLELIEYNNWGDRNWGVDIKTGEGNNRLGKLLMELRGLFQTMTVQKELF